MGFPDGASSEEPACQHRRLKRLRFHPWVGKIPWRRAWQPTPVSLPGELHGQRSLAGYSPWGRKESDTTEALMHPCFFTSLHHDILRKWKYLVHLGKLDEFRGIHLEFGSSLVQNFIVCCCCLLAKLCLILCNAMDCSPPDSSVHGILQARRLEWAAISFSKCSSWLRDRTWVSCIAGGFFTTESPGKPSEFHYIFLLYSNNKKLVCITEVLGKLNIKYA